MNPELDIAEIMTTQNDLRNVWQIRTMIDYVEAGGYFTQADLSRYVTVKGVFNGSTLTVSEDAKYSVSVVDAPSSLGLSALTGHIVDHLNTLISKQLWTSLSDEDKQIFTEVMTEAAARATKTIVEREAALVEKFRADGIGVNEVDKADFEKNVIEKVSLDDFGYRKEDWEAIRAIQ